MADDDGVLPFPGPPADPSTVWASDVRVNPYDAIEAFVATVRRRQMRLALPESEEALAQLVEVVAAGGRLACASDVYRRMLDLPVGDLDALGGPAALFEAPMLPAGTIAAIPRGMQVIPELLR